MGWWRMESEVGEGKGRGVDAGGCRCEGVGWFVVSVGAIMLKTGKLLHTGTCMFRMRHIL